jgi:hypothetical protein
LISEAIFDDCRKRRKNLNIAWIGYRKAFDTVPHSWIESSIELIRLNNNIVKLCKLSVEK